jgi:hypothetical protein
MQNGDFGDFRRILKSEAKARRQHAKIMADFEERMDRVGRHLKALASRCDVLYRDKADRKRRQG